MIKPLLSIKCPPDMTFEEFLLRIGFPVLATPKIDGIRCIKVDGKALSRTLKPIPNLHIRQQIESLCPDYVDGELIVGETFQSVTSGVMSFAGKPNFTYYVFGCDINLRFKPYIDIVNRLENLELPSFCKKLIPVLCNTLEELLAYEEIFIGQGAEGVMTRKPSSQYKYGRSTLNEQYLVAIKRFTDEECVVVGFEEQMSNQNRTTTNELGYTERSSSFGGLVPADTLGAFQVKTEDGREFKIGTGIGLTNKKRKEIWDRRDEYLNRTITFKYQLHGTKDNPRIPVFKGFRED